MNEVATLRSLPDVVAEYDTKAAAIEAELAAFSAAGTSLLSACSVGGHWGRENIDTGRPSIHTLKKALLRSAWLHVWDGLNLPTIASANDKKRFDLAMSDPPPFTIDNLRATFGPYLANPRLTILRGLAEVFADLDPAYKSHEKVKIGVKGLPKRVIMNNIGSFYSYGEERLTNILNALAAYQGRPLIDRVELGLLLKDGDALKDGGTYPHPHNSRHEDHTVKVEGRGIWLKRFANGNGHLFFGPDALRDINMALAEYYGEVLADCPEERSAHRPGTDVAKDLQYYPTPEKIAADLVSEAGNVSGKRVLEPSCGDGRILDQIRKAGGLALGVEVHAGRAAEARAKGHSVYCTNFLDMAPVPEFDFVIMNPPFYGKHYAKHIRHALRFLKPGGRLTAILPATARYDHGLLDDLNPRWHDQKPGAFAESGTNICTTILQVWA